MCNHGRQATCSLIQQSKRQQKLFSVERRGTLLPAMDLVPYRVSGPGADQALEHRLFQIGAHTVSIRQDPTVGVGIYSRAVNAMLQVESG